MKNVDISIIYIFNVPLQLKMCLETRVFYVLMYVYTYVYTSAWIYYAYVHLVRVCVYVCTYERICV